MKTTADLGRDSVRSLVLKLALPAMVAQFVNVLYSINILFHHSQKSKIIR